MSLTVERDLDDPLAAAAVAAPVACSRTVALHDGFEVVTLASADGLEASFAPRVGMACCSLRHRGVELLGERFGLAAYASCGLSTGLSLMHPWTNRLSSWRYTAGGTTVRLPISPLLHTDRWGLPVNGVQSKGHDWHVEDSGADAHGAWLEATLAFERPRQLALFPFPHRVHLRIELSGRALSLSTRIEATGRVPVPVCFGYRLYVRRDPFAQVCTYPGGPHATLEAMTAEPDALSHDTYPIATAARPYWAALKIAVDDAVEPAAAVAVAA